MTILLHDYYELEERAGRHLRAWKAWHITLYVFAAIFAILNYVFLQSSMQLVDNNCVLYPRLIELSMVEVTDRNYLENAQEETVATIQNPEDIYNGTSAQNNETNKTATEGLIDRESDFYNETEFETTIVVNNVTVVTGNRTHHLMLDTSRTLFGGDYDCEYAEYVPILSMIFALVWITFFTMCPGGGHARSGLHQPWRILTPALLFSLVLVVVTGHSFTITNGGLQAFCAAFYNVTNTTTCSAVSPFLRRAQNISWGMGERAAATRAASAGAWASWACVAALLLARCLAVPDFVVKKSAVYLTKDPDQKITPYLKKSSRSPRSQQSSPSKPLDVTSVRSEPTITTELVTASIEHQDSMPSSLMNTPLRHHQQRDGDIIEMAYSPHERDEDSHELVTLRK